MLCHWSFYVVLLQKARGSPPASCVECDVAQKAAFETARERRGGSELAPPVVPRVVGSDNHFEEVTDRPRTKQLAAGPESRGRSEDTNMGTKSPLGELP